jgi:hypothetical protein
MHKYKFQKYLSKIGKLKKSQIGGNDLTKEMWDEFVNIRKFIYDGFYDENGDITNTEIFQNRCLIDLEQFGQFVQKYDLKLDFFIGVTNFYNLKKDKNSEENSDYLRFSGKKNTIVVQNSSPINIFKCDPIGFNLNMNDDNVIQFFNRYFTNSFTNIIIDRATKRLLDKIEKLDFSKILNIGGKAYFPPEINSKDNRSYQIRDEDDFKEAYIHEKYNIPHLASEYIKFLKRQAETIILKLPRNIIDIYRSNMHDLEYQICKDINTNIGMENMREPVYGELNGFILIDSKKYYFKLPIGSIILNDYNDKKNMLYFKKILQNDNLKIEYCVKCSTYPVPKYFPPLEIYNTELSSLNYIIVERIS